jgi:hypothetical protein
MGIIASIGNALKSVVNAVKQPSSVAPITSNFLSVKGQVERVSNAAAVLSQSLNPFSESKPVANVQNKTIKTVLETVSSHPYASAAVVAAPIVAVKNPALTSSIATSLIPKTVVGKVATVAAVPIVAGAVISKPAESAKALISAPSSLSNFGGNVATLIADPSIENAKTVFKENPVISSTIVAGTVATVGLGAGSLISNALNTKAVKENTEATKSTFSAMPVSSSQTLPSTSAASPVSTPVTAPITPQTQIVTVGTKASSKKRKKVKKQIMPSIKQNVNVIVQNRNSSVGIKQTKKYLNKEILI